MLAATKKIREDSIKLQKLADISVLIESYGTDASDLSKGIFEFMGKIEKLWWLFLSYPDRKGKHSSILYSMLDSLTDKLGVFGKLKEYGKEDDSEALALIKKSAITIKEMNIALDTILENILSNDLLMADVELEALRQEIRLRGLY
jgi:5-bromo-4-chloroindolyl phosphate hydrolysis protein